MLTGDNTWTAASIARECGILLPAASTNVDAAIKESTSFYLQCLNDKLQQARSPLIVDEGGHEGTSRIGVQTRSGSTNAAKMSANHDSRIALSMLENLCPKELIMEAAHFKQLIGLNADNQGQLRISNTNNNNPVGSYVHVDTQAFR
jgi:magnesium-transporting ATPase (P-type)